MSILYATKGYNSIMYDAKPLKVKVGITIDDEVEKGIKKLAEKDDRSFSAYINKVLKQHIEENT